MTDTLAVASSICVYCGSSPGTDPSYIKAARALGRSIGEADRRLVYGGGDRGIMGAVAEATRTHGGNVTGIIPEFLIKKERPDLARSTMDMPDDHYDELIVTQDMHERKTLLAEKSDAFVAMPGGVGTLEELVEIMTWNQLGLQNKPIILGNINGFWDRFIDLIDQMKEAGFVHTANKINLISVSDPLEIVVAIDAEVGRLTAA